MLISFALRPMYYVGQFVYYGTNMDYIIENYCVNKERPQLKCDGKCFLAKKLIAAYDSETDDSKSVEAHAFFPVFLETPQTLQIDGDVIYKDHSINFSYQLLYSYNWYEAPLKPPIS